MRGNIYVPQIEIYTPCKQTATGDEESLKWHLFKSKMFFITVRKDVFLDGWDGSEDERAFS